MSKNFAFVFATGTRLEWSSETDRTALDRIKSEVVDPERIDYLEEFIANARPGDHARVSEDGSMLFRTPDSPSSDLELLPVVYEIYPDQTRYPSILQMTTKDPERWAIRDRELGFGNQVIDKHARRWRFEPQPSDRDEDFLRDCRFDSREEAINFVNENKQLFPPEA